MNGDSIPADELWVLSYYRASELAGALLFGRLARRTIDPEMAALLTDHFAEEARHAQLWTQTIRRLGHWPIRITETYQSRYAREIGLPTSIPQILVLTRVFEERICHHFSRHARRPNTHPAVKETLLTMLRDESQHLDWVGKKLAEYEIAGVEDIAGLTRSYREADERIYRDVLIHEKRLWDFLGAAAPAGSVA